MKMLLLWRGELGREHPSAVILEGFALKRTAVLVAIEPIVPGLEAIPYDIGHLTIGAALSYLEFRWPEAGWRDSHPALATWHAAFSAPPAVIATAHIDA